MNCSDHYGEDWGDVTEEKQEALEVVVDANLTYGSPIFLLNSKWLKPIPQADGDPGDDAA